MEVIVEEISDFDESTLNPPDSEEDEVARKVRFELEDILREHLSAVSVDDNFGFHLSVGTGQNHALHVIQHRQFLDSDVELNPQAKSAIRNHIKQHELAIKEGARLGLHRKVRMI